MDLIAAQLLIRSLLSEHGLAQGGWTFEYDNSKRRAGVCDHARREIRLSRHLTRHRDEADVRVTMLHEIAHALVGPGAGHGPVWRARAVSLGIPGERCWSIEQLNDDAPAAPWSGTCVGGHRNDRYRAPTRLQACSQCSSTFSARTVIAWVGPNRAKPTGATYLRDVTSLWERGQIDADRVRDLVGPARAQGIVGNQWVASPVAPPPIPVRVPVAAQALESLFAPRPAPPQRALGVGRRVRVVAGSQAGRTGTIVKVGRSRYHVKVGSSAWAILFEAVEPL